MSFWDGHIRENKYMLKRRIFVEIAAFTGLFMETYEKLSQKLCIFHLDFSPVI